MALDPQMLAMLQNPQALQAIASRLAATGQRPPAAPSAGMAPAAAPRAPVAAGGSPLGRMMNPVNRPVLPRPQMTAPVQGGPVPNLASLINPVG